MLTVAAMFWVAGCSKPVAVAVQGASETSSVKTAELEKCLTATSFEDYEQKTMKGVWTADKSGKKVFLPAEHVSVPLKINVEGAEIYNVPVGAAGGDLFVEPIIKHKDQYCELTDSNVAMLFSPITKESAIKYLDFRSITLARTTCGRWSKTILDKSSYEKNPCPMVKNFKVTEEYKMITSLTETSDGFLIRWIFKTGGCGEGYFRQDVTLTRDGKIVESRPADLFIECGATLMF